MYTEREREREREREKERERERERERGHSVKISIPRGHASCLVRAVFYPLLAVFN